MITVAERSVSIMIAYAIALHLVWAVILWFDASAVNATAVHALYRFVSDASSLSVLVGVAAVMAAVAVMTRSPWTLLLLLPQQILLMMSASGAVEAIWTSQFADGVIRPRAFIAADQFYSVLAAIGHTAAIIVHALNYHQRRVYYRE